MAEFEEVIEELTGKEFPCDCGKTHTLKRWKWYDHDGGLKDDNGNIWWLYWTCPSCGYQWAWHKIVHRLDRLKDERQQYEESFPEDARARRFDGGF